MLKSTFNCMELTRNKTGRKSHSQTYIDRENGCPSPVYSEYNSEECFLISRASNFVRFTATKLPRSLEVACRGMKPVWPSGFGGKIEVEVRSVGQCDGTGLFKTPFFLLLKSGESKVDEELGWWFRALCIWANAAAL